MKRMHLRGAVAAVVLGICALGVGTSGPAAVPVAAAQSTVSPQAALDWNLIAVNTVRAATPAKFQIEGALYMTYVQAAVYDAVAAIKGRDGKGKDTPYRKLGFSMPGSVPAGRGRVGGVLDARLLLPGAGRDADLDVHRLPQRDAGRRSRRREAGGRRGRSRGSRGPDRLSAGATDATHPSRRRSASLRSLPGRGCSRPPPSAQSAQTPWVGSMTPFVLDSASQFRSPAPPALTSTEYATDLNEVKLLGSVGEPRADAGSDRHRAVLERERDQPVQPGVPRRRHDARLRPGGHSAAAGDGHHDLVGRRHRVHGVEVPLPPVAPGDGDPRGGHRRQRSDRHGHHVVAAPDDAEPPGVPECARLRHLGRRRRARVGSEDDAHRASTSPARRAAGRR